MGPVVRPQPRQPAPVSMPQTVRRPGWARKPQASPQNVRNDGAVNRSAKADSSVIRDAGTCRGASGSIVDGHRDLPSDGQDVDSTAITESDRIPWSLHREICSERRLGVADNLMKESAARAQNIHFGCFFLRDVLFPGILVTRRG